MAHDLIAAADFHTNWQIRGTLTTPLVPHTRVYRPADINALVADWLELDEAMRDSLREFRRYCAAPPPPFGTGSDCVELNPPHITRQAGSDRHRSCLDHD